MSGIRLLSVWLLLLCTKASTAQVNIALNKTTRCSSTENAAYIASNVTDGLGTGLQVSNSGSCTGTCTRWSSGFSDPQWIRIDLGAYYTISNVKLFWEVANGKDFKIQIGLDTLNWATVQTVTANSAFANSYAINNVFGRYVRMYGTARNTPYGFSLWEMEVYGTFIVLPVKLSDFTAKTNATGIALSWKAYTDAATRFTIERSADGAHFSAIGSLDAAAGSNFLSRFSDALPLQGKNHYRLKWMEKGTGSISYSEIVTANTTGKTCVSLFPNPVTNGRINGVLCQPYSGLLTTKLYNTAGVLLGEQQQQMNYGTSFTVHINNALPKGVYWLDIVQHEFVTHRKVLVE